MKLLTLVLSFIVLTLTCVSCCELQESEADHSIHENAQNEEDCGPTCSPFYTCGSCVGFMTSQYPEELFVVSLGAIPHDIIHLSFKLPQAASSIWQPPQIS